MSCVGHATAVENAHKLLACWFQPKKPTGSESYGAGGHGQYHTWIRRHIRRLGQGLGVTIIPSRLKVTTAAQGSPLELVGTVASLVMGISPTNVLRLHGDVVCQNLGPQRTRGLKFCRQCKPRLACD
ncbi:MAG: hypothetical protein GY696_11440, partial [Gammaproteobacteria bacterium]|nr:hypothetical protein [Gammaproteobacteria bacterium]